MQGILRKVLVVLVIDGSVERLDFRPRLVRATQSFEDGNQKYIVVLSQCHCPFQELDMVHDICEEKIECETKVIVASRHDP